MQRGGQRYGGGAQGVSLVVIQAGGHLPVEHAFGVALDREPVHEVREVLVGDIEVRGRERVRAAVDVDRAAVHLVAIGVAQVARGAAFGLVVPPAQGIGCAHGGREVVRDLGLDVVLLRVVLRGRAQQVPGLVAAVVARHGTRHGRACVAHGACRHEARGEGKRLAFAVGLAEVEEPRPVAILVAHRGADLLARVGGIGAIQVKRLVLDADLAVRLELGRHARDVVHHRAHRVARIRGGERAVKHVHPLDLLGRDQHPARRIGGAVAQVVGEQDAIGKHHGPRRVARARGAGGQDGMVVVADVTLAHQQAGQVLEGVFAVGGVDRVVDLLARHALDGGGDLRGQRGGLAAGDGDHAQFLDGGIAGLGGLGERRHGAAEDEGKSVGQGQRHAALAHGNS